MIHFQVQGASVSNAQISLTLSLGIRISRPIVSIPPYSINHLIIAAKFATEFSQYLDIEFVYSGKPRRSFIFTQLSNQKLQQIPKVLAGVPDGATRLKTRSAAWIRAGWELNTLDDLLVGTFINI